MVEAGMFEQTDLRNCIYKEGIAMNKTLTPDIEEFTPVSVEPLKQYKVLLHNDDVHTIREVIHILQEVFKFSYDKAYCVMYRAHLEGVSLCGVYHLELAELRCDQLRSFGLTSTVEPA